MRFSSRYVPTVLLLILSLTASLSAQTADKQAVKTSRGTISGRVTIKDKPAAGVVVSLRNTENFMPFGRYQKATTDQEGSYRFNNIAAGSYELVPSAPAYVMADLKESRSKNVIVGDDENIEGINFALVRGGVITGRITDADGRPVIQQDVSLFTANSLEQAPPPGQPRQIFPAGSTQTDDRGIYRVFGLSPGRYKVASGRSEETFAMSFGSLRSAYKQVFYPDAGDQAKATVIEVSEGSEANNIDITLGRSLQTFAASGRVIDGEKGQPVPNIRFGLQRISGQRPEFVNSLVVSNAQGDFVVEGLLPGKYGVYLMTSGQTNEMRAETVNFEIFDQDVGGLTVKLLKGASLSGVIVLDTEDKTAFQKLSQLQLRGFSVGSAVFGGSAMSPIGPDGSFRLAGLAGGAVTLSLGTQTTPLPPKGFIISRIERDGVVQPRNVEIRDGEQVTGLRVIVSYGNSTVRGVVKLENGSLPEGGRLIVRLTKAGETSSPMRPAMADARGHFLMEGIPAGPYEISVSLMTQAQGPPRTVKREVSVQDGVVTDVVITMDLGAPQKP